MTTSFPYRLLIASVVFRIAFDVLAYLVPLPVYVHNANAQSVVYDVVMAVTFVPVVSLIMAILMHGVQYRLGVIWVSSVWLIYWLLLLVLYSLTMGRLAS